MKDTFTCHWCSRQQDAAARHHSIAGRDTCTTCYTGPTSNYHRAYGTRATARDEFQEVRRSRPGPLKVSPKELIDGFED